MIRPVRRLSVGIVGCGVGGCTAAIMLARQGHDVTLFEQSPRVGPVGAGVLLQASGQSVLRSLGLLDAVVANAERIEELVAFNHRGGLLSRLRFADIAGGHCAFGLHRGELFAALHAAVISAGVRLHLNHAIAALGECGRSIVDQSGQKFGPFDLVIAADGMRSQLRATSGAKACVHRYESAALWAIGRAAPVRGKLLQRTHHTRKLCGLLPMGGGRTSFFWGLRVSERRRLKPHAFAMWQDEVLHLMPEAEPLLGHLRSFDDLIFSTYLAVWMPRVFQRNIAFLGDAAHASSPLLGHGINLAMLDARDLTDSIASESSLADALRGYNAKQRWRNGYYSFLSAALTPSFQGRSSFIGVGRDLVLPLLQRLPPARYVMLRTLTGV